MVDLAASIDADVTRRARNIKLVMFDVDGVLTDGKITYSERGDETKSFHVQDGSAIRRLIDSGIEVALVTGRTSAIVERRAKELGIKHVHQGVSDKSSAFEALLATLDLRPEQCAHVGDDVPDVVLFEQVGLAIAVANGVPEARAAAQHVTERAGGEGVASEVCSMLLAAQQHSLE